MAFTLTPNLKLRVDSNLTANAKFNLNKIDTLAGVYFVSASETVFVRSAENLVLKPQDNNLGGTGSGGSVSVGEDGANVAEFNVFADSAVFSGEIIGEEGLRLTANSFYVRLVAPASLGGTYTLTLPESDGNANQVLTTDGNGTLSWSTPTGGGGSGGNELSENWTSGTSYTVTHGWNTRKVMVEVLDASDSYRTIYVDVTRPTLDTVVLTSSSAPSGTWVILLKEIL